tara:strand:- start:214 stop:636 length:423 start_codon:yes stop_codon:yes gene_type:complete
MKTSEITYFTLSALLPDWRFFKTAIDDLSAKGLAIVSIDDLTIWKQDTPHTVTAHLSAIHSDYVQIVQRLIGSQANNELESISLRVTDGPPSNVTEDPAGLTMTNTSLNIEITRSHKQSDGYCTNGLMFNEDKTIYGGWN